MERIEIRNENGLHLAYYKGVLLPALIKSKIIQDADGYTHAKLEFLVELEKPNSFEIKQSDLEKVVYTTINRNNAK